MSFFVPPIPICTPYIKPYNTCAASISPFTSLSRTAAQEASLLGMILMPYFSSNFITEAITTDAQSVNGMNPILTSVFSGASEPAAHAPCRIAGGAKPIIAAPVNRDDCVRNFRRGDAVAMASVNFVTLLFILRSSCQK